MLTFEYLKHLFVFLPQGKTGACFNTLDFLILSWIQHEHPANHTAEHNQEPKTKGKQPLIYSFVRMKDTLIQP